MLLAPATAQAEPPVPAPSAASDALDPLRLRFRAGMEKYQAGAYAEAILVWEPIYRELGPEKGYRLAFNLARAYDALGDEPPAIEGYEAYLAETRARHDAGETLEPLVLKQEGEAEDRLAGPRSRSARVHVIARPRVTAKVDAAAERPSGFVAYVPPGKHVVTWNPGTKDERRVEVDVAIGGVIDVRPPEGEAVSPSRPEPGPASGPASGRAGAAEPRIVLRPDHPFPGEVLWVAGGIAIASLVVPAVLYANADAVRRDYEAASTRAEKAPLRDEYENTAKPRAYAALAIPGVLGAAAVGLTAYWFLRTSHTRVPLRATVSGTSVTLNVRF